MTTHKIGCAHVHRWFLESAHPQWWATQSADDVQDIRPGDRVEFVIQGEIFRAGVVTRIDPPGVPGDDTAFNEWYVLHYVPDAKYTTVVEHSFGETRKTRHTEGI